MSKYVFKKVSKCLEFILFYNIYNFNIKLKYLKKSLNFFIFLTIIYFRMLVYNRDRNLANHECKKLYYKNILLELIMIFLKNSNSLSFVSNPKVCCLQFFTPNTSPFSFLVYNTICSPYFLLFD